MTLPKFSRSPEPTGPGHSRIWGCVVSSPDDLLPASIAAQKAGVSKQLFNYWRRSGKVQPAEEINGHPVYRLRDVKRVERVMRNSSQSRRQSAAHAA